MTVDKQQTIFFVLKIIFRIHSNQETLDPREKYKKCSVYKHSDKTIQEAGCFKRIICQLKINITV